MLTKRYPSLVFSISLAACFFSFAQSNNAPDTSRALQKRRIDSLTGIHDKLRQESQAVMKAYDDSLKTAGDTLREIRRLVAKKDSIVKTATTLLNALKNDSNAVIAKAMQGHTDRDREVKRIDSSSLALQDKKITLLNLEEKVRLDSIMEAVDKQLFDLMKAGTPPDSVIEEKQQVLESCKTKKANLLREKSLIAMVARYGKTGRAEVQRQTGAQLSSVQRSLDSLSKARESIEREKILFEKEFMEKSRRFAKRADTLSVVINRASNELVNLKARSSKIELDSAGMFSRGAAAADTYKKKLEPIAAELAQTGAVPATAVQQPAAPAGDGKQKKKSAKRKGNRK